MSNYHQLYYHAIWATKERHSWIDAELRQPLYSYLRGKIIDMGGLTFAVGGIEDHVHVCLMIPPYIAVATFIGRLKGASAHWINHTQSPGTDFRWQEGYGVITFRKEDLKRLVAYVEDQESHHHNGATEAGWEI